MVDRKLQYYSGEDSTPTIELTDLVIWEESEFGTRAHRGESTSSSVPFRDEQSITSHGGSIQFQARNVWEFIHGSNVIWRGRIANQSYTRGDQKAGRAREGSAYLEDVNIDWRGIVVHDWPRPAESDVARVQGLIARYLSGNPRATTIINGSNLVENASNLVTLPAKTYNQTNPDAIMSEIALAADKTYFLLPRRRTTDAHTAELFYDGNDVVFEACPFRITDIPSEIKAAPHRNFPPIWNVGAAAELVAQETLSGLYLFYGPGTDDYVHVSDGSVAEITAHWEEVIFDDSITTAAEAEAKANAIIQYRRSSERRINVTIGPLGDEHIGIMRAGQTITVRAMAVPWADDQDYDARIAELKFTTPLQGVYFAHMQLERPLRMGPYGVGDKPSTLAARPPICSGDCIETFTRTASPTWGTSEINDLVYGGSGGSIFTADGDEGVVRVSTTDTGVYSQYIDAPFTLPFELVAKMRIVEESDPGGLASGEPEIDFGLALNNAEAYTEGVAWSATWAYATRDLTVLVRNNQGTSGFPGGDLSDLADGREFWLRLRIESDSIKHKLWFNGDSEPGYTTFSTTEVVPSRLLWFISDFNSYPSVPLHIDHFQIVEGLDCSDCYTPTGGPEATQGDDLTHYAGALHDHDSVDNGDAAGGELGGTYPNPTVDTTHAGSNHNQPVRKNSTGTVFERRRLNFIEGTNVTLTVADDAGNDEVDITVASSGGGAASLTVEEADGSPSVTSVDTIVFDGATVTDDTGGQVTVTIAGGTGEPFDPANKIIIYEECAFRGTAEFYHHGFVQEVSGASAITFAESNVSRHPGIIGLATGTTTGGRVAMRGNMNLFLGDGDVEFGTVFRIGTSNGLASALSDATDAYTARLGFGNTTAGASPNDGVFFRYTHSVNSGKWQAVCRSGGVETASDTGSTADLSWHKFEITINAARTSTEFFIDGASVATITTNIPVAATALSLIPVAIIKSAGTTSRQFSLDAFWYTLDLATSR